MKLGPDLNFLL